MRLGTDLNVESTTRRHLSILRALPFICPMSTSLEQLNCEEEVTYSSSNASLEFGDNGSRHSASKPKGSLPASQKNESNIEYQSINRGVINTRYYEPKEPKVKAVLGFVAEPNIIIPRNSESELDLAEEIFAVEVVKSQSSFDPVMGIAAAADPMQVYQTDVGNQSIANQLTNLKACAEIQDGKDSAEHAPRPDSASKTKRDSDVRFEPVASEVKKSNASLNLFNENGRSSITFELTAEPVQKPRVKYSPPPTALGYITRTFSGSVPAKQIRGNGAYHAKQRKESVDSSDSSIEYISPKSQRKYAPKSKSTEKVRDVPISLDSLDNADEYTSTENLAERAIDSIEMVTETEQSKRENRVVIRSPAEERMRVRIRGSSESVHKKTDKHHKEIKAKYFEADDIHSQMQYALYKTAPQAHYIPGSIADSVSAARQLASIPAPLAIAPNQDDNNYISIDRKEYIAPSQMKIPPPIGPVGEKDRVATIRSMGILDCGDRNEILI